MALPEENILREGDILSQQRDPGFLTEDLPSPGGFEVPNIAPIPIPGTGDFTPAENSERFMEQFNASVLGTQDKLTPGRIPSFSASEVFNPRYRSILPGEDSEEAFGKAQPWYNKWANALVKTGAFAAGTFWNTVTAIPDTVASIGSGQPWNTETGADIDRWLKNLENDFPNYYTKWQQEHPFMSAVPFSGGFANFWGDKFLKNLGFTIGAIGGAVATDLIVAAATKGIGEIPLVANQIGRAALYLNKIFTGADKVSDLMALGQAVGRTPQQLVQLESLARAAAATRALNGTRYALALYGSAASEAGFEAREGYNTVREELLTAYQRENGYSATGKELEDIERYAKAAGNTRFGINLVLLGISNAIQFETFLKPFTAAKAGFRSSIQKELSASQIGLREGSIDVFEKVVPSTVAGKIWSKIRPVAPSIFSEGIFEEGGQYATQIGTENYYVRNYLYDKGIPGTQYMKDETPWDARSQMNNIMHSISEGMEGAYGTDSGLESVFLGAITGALTGGVQNVLSKSRNDQERMAVLNLLNSQGITGTIRNNYDAAVKSQRIAEDMKEAARNNDVFKYKNFQHEQFVNFVVSGLRANRFDVRIEQLNMLKDMSDEEFKKAFGLDKTTENVRTVTEYVDALRNEAISIRDTYNLIENTFTNPFAYKSRAANAEQSLENEKYHQFNQWKDELVYLARVLPEATRREGTIALAISAITPAVSPQAVRMLTNRDSVKRYINRLKEEAGVLQRALDDKTSPDREADTKRANLLNKHLKALESALSEKELSGDKYARIFADILTFIANGETDEPRVTIPQEAVNQLIQYGIDLNRLEKMKQAANEAFEKLSSEEGFNKYFNTITREQQKASTPPQPATAPVAPAPAKATTQQTTPTSVIVKSPQNQQFIFDQDAWYFVNIDPNPAVNPERVKVRGQNPNGVVIEKEDGSTAVVPNDVFFREDKFTEDINEEVDDATTKDGSAPPPNDQPGNVVVGEDKKDLAFGLYSTTDPTYNVRTTPDDNFQRRHQNFLFNLGSSNPELFNQENKGKLRIIPITAKTQELFGFPEDWITDKGDDPNNSSIRAVYVVDMNVDPQKAHDEIIAALTQRQPEMPGTFKMWEVNSDFIDFIYQQAVGLTQEGADYGTPARDEMIKLTGSEELLDKIIALREGRELYYVDENGNVLSQITREANPNRLIYTNLASTDITFQNGPRYTNKENLDEKKVQDWWREKRAEILAVDSVEGTPIFQFYVSRGRPNVANYDTRNSVVESKLIREEDMDLPIITVATQGNVAVLGAYNASGEGISAAKAGINMPLGTPLLNFGGNLEFLNTRKLTQSEAANIFELLKVISDRSSTENKSALFKFLNKVVYLANPKKGIMAGPNSITIDGSSLFLGTSKDPIQLAPASLDLHRGRIVDFLNDLYHVTNNSELLRIARNPKANDLEFAELDVYDGKVKVARRWKNYNYYLLSSKAPDGKNRGEPPLTTHIVVPMEGEVPIVQKYSVLKGIDFDSHLYARASGQPTSSPTPPPIQPQQPIPQQAAQTQGVGGAAEKLQWVEVDLGGSLVKLVFKDVVRDAQDNIIDLTPVGIIEEGKPIKPFTKPEVVKQIILDNIRKSQIKKDDTNSGNDMPWLGGNGGKKEGDDQYRAFNPANNDYKRANLAEEFKEFHRIIPDDILIRQTDHLLRTTSGGFAWGALRDKMVYIYKHAEVGTVYHEAFEVIWNHFLSGSEQQDIYNEFLRRDGTFKTFTGQTKNFSEASLKEAKEQIAEEFRDYKLNGTLPQGPKAKSFLRRLLDFIKRIIFGDEYDVNLLFKRMNQGYYRNYSTPLRDTAESAFREVGLEQFSEAFVQDVLQGMTIEMFQQAYREASDIVSNIEEGGGAASWILYEKLRSRLVHYFEQTDPKYGDTLAAEFNDRYKRLTKDDDREAMRNQIRSILENWQRIKDNWPSFTREHKRYMRVFNVEFVIDDEGNIAFSEEVEEDVVGDSANQVEYDRDIFRIDAKNSASLKVKLLIATMADSYWQQATAASIGAARNPQLIGIKRDNSLMFLPKQVQYAKVFNYMLHNTSNINGLYDIVKRLKEMTSDREHRKPIDANVQRLINRLSFDRGFEGKTPNQAKLLLSLENTLSKQKPEFFRQFVDFQRNTFFKTSVLNSKIDQIKQAWIADIKGSGIVMASRENVFIFSPSVIGIADNLRFLSKVGIDIEKKEYDRLSARDQAKFNKAVNNIKSLIEKAAREKTQIPIMSAKHMDFDSRLSDLAEIYVTNITGDDTQSQHPNLDNEPTSNFVLNNFVSTVLNDANSSATRDEFLSKKEMGYFNDIFHEDSWLLNSVIFDADGKFNRAVQLGVVEGRETWNQDNRSASKLTEAERQLYEINNNLNGVFYTLLPADAKTEWAINSGTFLNAQNFFGDDSSRSNEITRLTKLMYNWLDTEVELAKGYGDRTDIVALNRKIADRTVGNSLRFFKDILPKEIVDKIHISVIDNEHPLDRIITEEQLRPIIREFAERKAEAVLNNLIDWKIIGISGTDGNEYRLNGFDRTFLDTYLGKRQHFTRTEVVRLLGFREMNYIVNNIELHKFFFGDPAQYKDELKRIKSFLSGREVMHVDTLETSEGFDQWANTALNMVNNEVLLKEGDPGWHHFGEFATTITVFDIDFESNQIDEIEDAIGAEKAKPYRKGNEADAQAYLSNTAYREILWKSGGRFTNVQERQFQWELAWERQDRAKEGLYTYTSDSLRAADNELLKAPADTTVEFPILKLVHSGMQVVNGNALASLDKASWAPLFYRWVKGTKLGTLYNRMQEDGIDYVRMESAHKVGIQRDGLVSLYDTNGNINGLAISKAIPEYIPHKFMGVQVEQSKKSKGQTEGSQARKMVTADLMSNGVPIDYISQFSTEDEAYDSWNKLEEKEKLRSSAIYKKVKRHDDAIERLTWARVDDTMRKLGITMVNDQPVINDRQRVSEFLLGELERRELPRNIAYGLEIDPATGDFAQPLEANAQYKKIRDILYSVMDRTIMRPTVNGGQKTLLAVTGWEKGARVIKRMVNGKPVYTSDTLKFYTRGEDKTVGCEIMLPYWFGKKLLEQGSLRTKEEVIKYLNTTKEGQRLLRGVGFRIPTQGPNSIDFFTVKDFLPEQMGSVAIFPSEITVKAGSDFDIDKINMYLYNFYVDNATGYPKMVEWKGSIEKTKEYIGQLLDSGNVITRQQKEELDRIIAEETEDLDENNLLMRIPAVMAMFTDEAITRDFLGKTKEFLTSKLTMQAMENEFFDAIEDLMSLPEKYASLVAPNDASDLKDLRDKLKKIKGLDTQENSLGDYGRLVDSMYMMQERQAYMASKGVVGTSAVSQTAHAVSQNMQGGLIIEDPSIEARFAANYINGKLTLSGLHIAGTNKLISNINSQTTDGGVDVSKDKFLAEMGITSDTLKNFLSLVRMGASPEWAVLYINQPSIQEFLKLKAIHNSVSSINPRIIRLPDWRLLNRVYAKFGGVSKDRKELKNKPKRYTIEQMTEMIRAIAQGEQLNAAQKKLQLMILDDYTRFNRAVGRYEGYEALAWDLFHFYQGYNWDTARLNDPNAIRLKQLRFDKANGLPISPVTKVMSSTFIGAMKRSTERLDRALRTLIGVQTGQGGDILDKIAWDLFNQVGLNEQLRRSLLLAAELAMVDYLIQTRSNIAGQSLNTFIYPLMLGDKAVARYIRALQKSNDKRLANNPFIKNLIASIDSRQGYPSVINLLERDYDTYTSNVWTDAFREMKDDVTVISINNNEADDRTVAQIYKNLVLAALIQSGSKRGSNSISHLIPNVTYSEFTQQSLKNQQFENFYNNYTFYRALWTNNRLVPQVEMEQLDPQDPTSPLIYTYLRSAKITEALKEITQLEKPGNVLNLQAWKYKGFRAVKILDPLRDEKGVFIGVIPRLFVRVDTFGDFGRAPLSVTKGRILFREINAWGDATTQEFYAEAKPSVLPLNPKVQEYTDDALIYALSRAGFPTNTSDQMLFDIVRKYEGDDDPSEDDQGNRSPDPNMPDAPLKIVETDPNHLPLPEPMDFPMPAALNIIGKDTTTFDQIVKGERTSTTRSYWHNVAKGYIPNAMEMKGKTLTFGSPDGRIVSVEVIDVHKITKEDLKNKEFMEQWSQKENWTVAHLKNQKFVGSYQVEFRLSRPSGDDIQNKIDNCIKPS